MPNLNDAIEWDQYGVIETLLTHQSSHSDAEGILRLLGFVHLYRTSGIHLLGLFYLIECLAGWLHLRFQSLSLRSILFLKNFLIFSISFLIWKLEGFHPSLFRPLFTYLFRQYLREKGQVAPFFLPLFLTVISEWIISGMKLSSEGALHYYASVGGGLCFLYLYPKMKGVKFHIGLSLFSYLPIAGVDLYRYHLISFLTPFYSFVSIPFFSFILYPLTLIDFLVEARIHPCLLEIWNQFFRVLLYPAEQGLSFFVVSKTAVGVAAVFAIALLSTRRFGKRIYVFFIPLCLAFHFYFIHKTVATEVIQVDVGQGDSAIFKKEGRVEMVDTGSAKKVSAEEWLKKLSHYQVMDIHSILFTHYDEDHMGGLRRLLPLLPVQGIVMNSRGDRYLPYLKYLEKSFSGIEINRPGSIQLLSYQWFQSKRAGAAGNEIMAGLVFHLDENHAYFALGDGDQIQEAEYLRYFDQEIRATPFRIWKLGHHGSKNSSNLKFLKRIDPAITWISVGKRNPYHHPHPLVLNRLCELGLFYQRTDEVGDLSFSLTE